MRGWQLYFWLGVLAIFIIALIAIPLLRFKPWQDEIARLEERHNIEILGYQDTAQAYILFMIDVAPFAKSNEMILQQFSDVLNFMHPKSDAPVLIVVIMSDLIYAKGEVDCPNLEYTPELVSQNCVPAGFPASVNVTDLIEPY